MPKYLLNNSYLYFISQKYNKLNMNLFYKKNNVSMKM